MTINRRDCNNMSRNPIKVDGDAGVTFSGQPLPCPFCGGSEFWLHGDIHPKFVACKKCSAFGPTAPTVSQAIERWNVRQGREHSFKVHSHGAGAMRADSDRTTRPNPMPSGSRALSRSQTIFRSVYPMSTKGRIQRSHAKRWRASRASCRILGTKSA
jgi:Lar family restriction alleviation protein